MTFSRRDLLIAAALCSALARAAGAAPCARHGGFVEAASALGLSVPAALLVSADELIR